MQVDAPFDMALPYAIGIGILRAQNVSLVREISEALNFGEEDFSIFCVNFVRANKKCLSKARDIGHIKRWQIIARANACRETIESNRMQAAK